MHMYIDMYMFKTWLWIWFVHMWWHHSLPKELPTPEVCEDGLQQSGIRPSPAPSTGEASETEWTGGYLQTAVWGQNEEGRQGVQRCKYEIYKQINDSF